jgi:SAM-dependent methyltransferase
MPADYRLLAPVYDAIGLGEITQGILPRIMDYVQGTDWAGRRIMVLGCGTGVSVEYLNRYNYSVQGVDNAPAMLAAAQKKSSVVGTGIRWIQADMRESLNFSTTDLVLAINCMNELNSLRDLESILSNIQRTLESRRLFVFDLITVKGLIAASQTSPQLLRDDPQGITVFTTAEYDFERHALTRDYRIFTRQGTGWARGEAREVLRAFPVQAVASLIQRAGLQLQALLTTDMTIYDAGRSDSDRVVFIVER